MPGFKGTHPKCKLHFLYTFDRATEAPQVVLVFVLFLNTPVNKPNVFYSQERRVTWCRGWTVTIRGGRCLRDNEAAHEQSGGTFSCPVRAGRVFPYLMRVKCIPSAFWTSAKQPLLQSEGKALSFRKTSNSHHQLLLSPSSPPPSPVGKARTWGECVRQGAAAEGEGLPAGRALELNPVS